jgi:two-component system, LuxR family, response regulator FixJ
MTTSDATVFVVDGDVAVRNELGRLLQVAGYRAQTFASAEELLAELDCDKLTCLIVAIRLPGMGGMELQACLTAKRIDIPIIFLTAYGDVPTAVQAMRRGAVDFIEKPFHSRELLDRVREAIARGITARRRKAEWVEAEGHLAILTTREHEVLRLMAAGHPTKIIAAKLGIARRTVEDHRAHVMRKMQCDSLPELVSQFLLVQNHATAISST